MDQILETSFKRVTDRGEHELEADDRPNKSSEINNDSLYLTKYMKRHAVPQTLNEFTEEHSEELRDQVYDILVEKKIPCQHFITESTIDSRLGKIFSNVLMAAYVPTLKRKGISYKLYTQRFTNSIPFHSLSVKVPEYDNFNSMLMQWLGKFNLDVVQGSTRIIRSGLLIGFRFHQDLTTGQMEGHHIFLLAEKKKDKNTVIYIVDNIDDVYYSKHCSHFNIHDLIKTTLSASDFPNVLTLKNNLPTIDETCYTCVASARRAAIYAAIMKDFAKTSTWNESYEPQLFRYHYNHYLFQMNKMLKWFDRTKEFWNPPYWTLWASEDFFPYNQTTYRSDDIIVELTQDIAYIRVFKEGNFVKLWFNQEGSPAFVENKESSGCRTCGMFTF